MTTIFIQTLYCRWTSAHLSFADGFPVVPTLPTGGAFGEAVEIAHT